MKPDLSRRNVSRLAREYGLPEGAIRQMLTMEAGTNFGDVVASSSRKKWVGFGSRGLLFVIFAVVPPACYLILRSV